MIRTILSLILLVLYQYSFAIQMDTQDALDFFSKNKKSLEASATQFGMPTALVAAIGLPEYLRYQAWQNALEVKALEIRYLSEGTKGADFSVGFFQIKPSFVEALECHITSHEDLTIKYLDLLPEANQSLAKRRRHRLNLLATLEGQYSYLCAYLDVIYKIYPHLRSEAPKNQLSFIATAYNYGFEAPRNKIEAYRSVKAFPYGKKFAIQQDAYCDVAINIYENLLSLEAILCYEEELPETSI